MTLAFFLALWAWSGLVIHLMVSALFVRGIRQLVRIENITSQPRQPYPKVSIVLAARNEERHVRSAIQTLSRMDYPHLEIIAVDDRSTDGTREILEQLAAQDSRISVLHIDSLPEGWLGKNHALYRGAERARGEWILFTDADVFMKADTLRRAVHYAQQQNVDLLAALPGLEMPGWWLETFALVFMLFFCLYFQPWRARRPNSRSYIGVGAFTLVRASTYHELGGHRPIAMRPDDDVRLGKLFKEHGKRIDVVRAAQHVRVPWYSSWADLQRGLEKNLFSGVDYRMEIIIVSSLAALLFNVAPYLMVFLAEGWARWAFGASCCVLWAMSLTAARAAQMRLSAALGFPLAVLLFVYLQWRTMIVNLWYGGIRWRDTFYSWEQLKPG
ncbi:MAG: hypothetical protein KatS3mg110_2930 [Pirellulaceae bacterium]|nr:MAG: hypothetical protein KatS3mg110_2930 [Pirellulaceae bacterium]